jgi:phosphate transport system protein
MFEWLTKITGGGESGLSKMTHDLERMIQEGRHAFDAACTALLGGGEPSAIRDDLLATDRRIDLLEQGIRRQILVHGSVTGSAHLPELMVLMSVSKDAERIGDYAKNLFALTGARVVGPGTPHHDELQSLRREVSSLLADAPAVYESQDAAQANEFIARAQRPIDECETRMVAIFVSDACTGHDAACALAFRHIRRVAGHVQNVVTAVVNPVDMLDFADEPTIPDAE